MRLLAIHRYYWPDTPPYAALLRVIAEHWAERGHAVEVLSSQPSYKPELRLAVLPGREVLNGVTVTRLAMKADRLSRRQRIVNVIRFPLLVLVKVLFGPKRDLVMCSTAPPIVLALLTCLAAQIRGSRFVYHCMDLHPEIGRLSGEFRNPLLFTLLRALDTWTCRHSFRVVVLSEDMAKALVARDPELTSKVVVITNFELPDFESAISADTHTPSRNGRLRLVFTGNIGRFQGLQQLARAVLDPAVGDRLELVLMGEGAAKAELESIVAAAPQESRDRVQLLPHSSVAAAIELMRGADLGVVSLAPDVIRYAYPSKTASYLAQGLPVLAAVEGDSGLACQIRLWQVGGVLPLQDPEALVGRLRSWVERRDELPELRERARHAWEETFSIARVLPQWDDLLERTA